MIRAGLPSARRLYGTDFPALDRSSRSPAAGWITGAQLIRLVVEVRAQPSLDGGDLHAFAPAVFQHLVPLDPPHTEIARLGMGEVEPGDRAGGNHGAALGQVDPGVFLDLKQVEDQPLLGVVGRSRITRRWPDTPVSLSDQVLDGQLLIPTIT